jgi:hypothetical protein
MRVMVRFTMLAATAAFVLAFYSTATGRDVMDIVERATLTGSFLPQTGASNATARGLRIRAKKRSLPALSLRRST